MKLFINFLLLTFIVIRTDGNEMEAKLLKEAFLNAYELPESWFLITNLNDSRRGKILDIKLNKKGEPVEFSKNDKQIIALKILKKKEL